MRDSSEDCVRGRSRCSRFTIFFIFLLMYGPLAPGLISLALKQKQENLALRYFLSLVITFNFKYMDQSKNRKVLLKDTFTCLQYSIVCNNNANILVVHQFKMYNLAKLFILQCAEDIEAIVEDGPPNIIEAF